MAAPLLGAKKHPFPPLPTFQLSACPGALVEWSLLWHWYLSPLRVYCTYISWTNVHFSFFRQTENNVFEPLSIRVECWNLFWSVSTGQVTKGQVWFWIWTYKIIPDLWGLDLFWRIKKMSTLHPTEPVGGALNCSPKRIGQVIKSCNVFPTSYCIGHAKFSRYLISAFFCRLC